MLLSKRRLQWGTILGLVILAMLLIRPARSWVDQVVVRQWIDPHITVDAVRFHPSESVVQIDNVRWSRESRDRTFGFTADHAWLAIDVESMLDGTLRIPHTRIENAELFLGTRSVITQPTVSAWQEGFARHVATLDWGDVRKHFGSLLTAETVSTRWTERIERWVMRSRDILARVQAVERSANSLANPLRMEDELRSELAVVDELTKEQQILLGQFDGIQKLLQAEQNQLRDTFALDVIVLHEAVLESPDNTMEYQRHAESVLRQIAHRTWNSFANYAEISASNASGFPATTIRPAYDRDVSVGNGSPVADEPTELHVEGIYRHEDRSMPFVLHAEFTSEQGVLVSSWNYRFSGSTASVQVVADRNTHDTGSDVLVTLDAFPAEPTPEVSPSDVMVLTIGETVSNAAEAPQPAVHLAVTFSEDHIAGEMMMDVYEMATYCNALFGATPRTEDCGELTQSAFANVNKAERTITVHVAGTWSHPEFTFPSGPPETLVAAIESELETSARSEIARIEEQVRREFRSTMQQLQVLVDVASKEGKSITESHQRQLLSAQRSLQQDLDEITGITFARRADPNATLKQSNGRLRLPPKQELR